MTEPVYEWQIESIKESLSKYNETVKEYSPLSDYEKEEQKHQMKQILEVFIHGVKDKLIQDGRFIEG